MPQPPLFPSETQEAQMSPGQGKSKAARAKARKKRKAAGAATTPALAVQPSPPRPFPPSPKATYKPAPVAPVPSVHDYASDVKASPPPSVVLSQSLPSLSSYQNSTPPPPSPPPPAIPPPAHHESDADDGFIVVSRAKKPKTTQPIPNPVDVEEAERLQFWWNNGFRPPDNTWDWQTEPERRASKVETWLEGLQQLTTPLDPPETQVIEHAVEPKQSVVPKRVQQRIAAAMPKPKPQVRWGK